MDALASDKNKYYDRNRDQEYETSRGSHFSLLICSFLHVKEQFFALESILLAYPTSTKVY